MRWLKVARWLRQAIRPRLAVETLRESVGPPLEERTLFRILAYALSRPAAGHLDRLVMKAPEFEKLCLGCDEWERQEGINECQPFCGWRDLVAYVAKLNEPMEIRITSYQPQLRTIIARVRLITTESVEIEFVHG